MSAVAATNAHAGADANEPQRESEQAQRRRYREPVVWNFEDCRIVVGRAKQEAAMRAKQLVGWL